MLDLHLLEAAIREGQGEQPHGGAVIILHVGLGVANASAILPLLQSLPLAKDVHQAVDVLLPLRKDVEAHALRKGGEAGSS